MSSDDAAIAPASGEKPSCAARCSGKWAQFKRFMYKPETGQVMDRLPFEWLQLLGYFLVFYTCLGAFFYGNLRAFMLTMHPQKPSLTGSDNLLRLKPGLGYRPQPRVEDNLIRYTMGVVNSTYDENNKENETFGYQKYVDALDKFFEPYSDNNTYFQTNKTAGNLTVCNATLHADYTRSCIFDLTSLGDCAPTWVKPGSTYGYANGEPCVLIKLNKVYGWLPAINDSATVEKWSDLSALGKSSKEIEQWGPFVNCSGEHAADKDVMTHRMPNITYFPSQHFSPLFYPYLNQKFYLAPVVMVQLKGIPKNSVLQVECRLWGTGIDYYDKLERMASVHFEVLVDEGTAAATTAAPAAPATAAPKAAPATIKP
jgi:sodium/potassium-transporting ATPase subunit beta